MVVQKEWTAAKRLGLDICSVAQRKSLQFNIPPMAELCAPVIEVVTDDDTFKVSLPCFQMPRVRGQSYTTTMSTIRNNGDKGKKRKKVVVRPGTDQFWLQLLWKEGTLVGKSGLWIKYKQVMINHLGKDIFQCLILETLVEEQLGVYFHFVTFLVFCYVESVCMSQD